MPGPGTYDLAESARRILEEKAKRRLALREQFLQQKTNPFQHATGEGGAVFDPALQRYSALRVTNYEHFKPSGKNAIYGLAFMVIPMGIYFYALYTSRNNQEAKYRRGEVAYKDRNFKFI